MGVALPHRPMRVVYLITDLEIGGAQRALERLVTGLDRGRFEPAVIALGAGPIADALLARGIPVESLGMRGWRDAGRLVRLLRLVRAIRPDVLHAFMFHANVAARLVGRLAGVPRIVTSVHGLDGPRWHHAIERLTGRPSDRVLFVGEAVRRFAGRAAGLSGDVVYNGVLEPDAAAPRFEGLVIATAGRLAPGKGMRKFLRAAALLAPRFPAARFVVIGRGPLEPELRSLASELGIADRVRFDGWRDDVAAALSGAAVFVNASRSEGVPTVVVEAMMAGVPVVATDVGGTREAVEDGVTGVLIRSRDPAVVAAAVARVIEDRERSLRMAARAREAAHARFGMPTMIGAVERLYRHFASRR